MTRMHSFPFYEIFIAIYSSTLKLIIFLNLYEMTKTIYYLDNFFNTMIYVRGFYRHLIVIKNIGGTQSELLPLIFFIHMNRDGCTLGTMWASACTKILKFF
jgi:hypothetical protein